ncbi:MAG: ABC transporter permease [Lachnospiraceae bacterium]|nr:ABC transporter permease [Lachnospiraceae bacterium]
MNSSIHGWKKVFMFSFLQESKQKSYHILVALMFIIALVSVPIMSYVNSDEKKEKSEETKITKIWVYDETGLGIDYSKLTADEKYKSVNVVSDSDISYEKMIKKLEKSKNSTEVTAKVAFDEDGFFVMDIAKSPKSNLSIMNISDFADDFREFFKKEKISALNVTEEQVDYLTQKIDYNILDISEKGEIIEGEGLNMNEYNYVYGLLIIATIMISFSGQKLATSIINEKSTRVIEYLTINVKPLALLVGKLLASILLVFIQFLAIGIGALLSVALNRVIFGDEAQSLSELLSGLKDILAGLSPASVLIVLIMLLCGIIFYDLIAGLAGSTVSKLEEMNDGMTLFTGLLIVGAYIGIALVMAEITGNVSPLLKYICTFLPISAPFVVPGYLLMGKISIVVAILSLAILAIATVFMFIFTAKAFVITIMYQGNTLKFKDIIRLLNNKQLESEGK